jgi:hypothetical protein
MLLNNNTKRWIQQQRHHHNRVYSLIQPKFLSTTTTTTSQQHEPLSMDLIVDIVDTTQLYLSHGKPGKRLDELKLQYETKYKNVSNNNVEELDLLFASQWREMTSVWIGTQVHVVVPFGFTPDQQGMQNYAMEVGRCLMQAGKYSKTIIEFQDLSYDLWKLMLKRCMGIDTIKKYELTQIRQISSQFSATAQTPDILQLAEQVNTSIEKQQNSLSVESKSDMMIAKLMMPLFKKVLTTNQKQQQQQQQQLWYQQYAECQANLQIWSIDSLVQNNTLLGMSALLEKAPLLQGR